jgi:hypothetical protein
MEVDPPPAARVQDHRDSFPVSSRRRNPIATLPAYHRANRLISPKTSDWSLPMPTRHAVCCCGQLSVTTTGEPVRISICHCCDCQRRTGSPFGAQARFDLTGTTIEGESSSWLRTADSGNRIAQHFCPVCGSTVYYLPEQEPGLIAVPVGGFADPAFPNPTVSVYESRRHPWVGIPADIEHHD